MCPRGLKLDVDITGTRELSDFPILPHVKQVSLRYRFGQEIKSRYYMLNAQHVH